MNELALFAGAGGGILAGKLLGWRTVCAVERDAYAATVLAQRQNDGVLEPFPIWSDVCSFDGRPWHGIVDVVSGGFPCQDISAAGAGAGIDGARSGLWREMARIVREVRPRYVFVENSPMLTSRGLGRVLGDLAAMGFDAEWGVLSAAAVGAPHLRERIWIMGRAAGAGFSERAGESVERPNAKQEPERSGCALAHANAPRELQPQRRVGDVRRRACDGSGALANPDGSNAQGVERGLDDTQDWTLARWRQAGLRNGVWRDSWWATEPNVGRVAHGVANRVDRIKSLGNGQVPACAAAAWRQLFARINQE